MPSYPTPRELKPGETRPFPFDWSARLAEVGATSIIASSWDVESGSVDLGASTHGLKTSSVQLTGSFRENTDSVIVNSVITDNGARLAERFHVFTTEGDFSAEAALYFFGAGAHGLGAGPIAALDSVLADNPVRETTISPSGQACYWAFPAVWAVPAVYLSGFPVPILSARSVVISGQTYSVLETEELHTGSNLVFDVRVA